MEAAAEKEKCVMVVSEEEPLLALLKVSLELEGLRVIEAAGAAAAISMIRKEQPNLIMLDIAVPEKNGVQALRKLAATDESGIPVIMLASEGGREELAREVALGARGHITKPFDAGQMVRTVKAALGMLRR